MSGILRRCEFNKYLRDDFSEVKLQKLETSRFLVLATFKFYIHAYFDIYICV